MDRLGFGLHPFQGFPVRGSISACHAILATSALFKPDVRISRIRLTRILSATGMHRVSVGSFTAGGDQGRAAGGHRTSSRGTR